MLFSRRFFFTGFNMQKLLILFFFLIIQSAGAKTVVKYGLSESVVFSKKAEVLDNSGANIEYFNKNLAPDKGSFVINKVIAADNKIFIALNIGGSPSELQKNLRSDSKLKILKQMKSMSEDSKYYCFMIKGPGNIYINIVYYKDPVSNAHYYIAECGTNKKTIEKSYDQMILLLQITRFKNIETN